MLQEPLKFSQVAFGKAGLNYWYKMPYFLNRYLMSKKVPDKDILFIQELIPYAWNKGSWSILMDGITAPTAKDLYSDTDLNFSKSGLEATIKRLVKKGFMATTTEGTRNGYRLVDLSPLENQFNEWLELRLSFRSEIKSASTAITERCFPGITWEDAAKCGLETPGNSDKTRAEIMDNNLMQIKRMTAMLNGQVPDVNNIDAVQEKKTLVEVLADSN